MTLLEIGKKAVFAQFLKNPSNGSDVSLTWVFNVDRNVIKVNNDKDIEFLSHDLVNIALEAGRCIRQPKKHYLVLEVIVLSPENRVLFIAFFYPYPMVSTHEVELDGPFCSA